MKNISLLVLVASMSFIAGAVLTYVAKTPWSSDMANQPSIKPQEWPLLPPEGSVATELMGGSGPMLRQQSESAADHQEMGHQHGASTAAGHHKDGSGGKHDHGPKENPPGTGHPHGKSAAAGHSHDAGAEKHEHGPLKAGKPPAKAAPHDHGSHSHAGGAQHDHGARGDSAGKKNIEKMKAGESGARHEHHHGAGAGDAHGHGAAAGQLINPIQASEASVKRGHELFNIYCSVCHGRNGRGSMPMASKLPGIPKFTAELLRSVDDTHMFTMVTNGHGPMPGYAEALAPDERWHVTNYIRTLQKLLADEKNLALRQRHSR